ncbi:uncharacterized protein LTR77_006139 [Saxophila tyrrhenica]|uniref:Uncharacterized protein n=1 Tax=Saxophila tyrrhenica TaxID=1690608 RepID=A0AAV9PB69_9PEZI|nr:hypothetical protein LTR77_006139 [Saxophila tyrrhenica]
MSYHQWLSGTPKYHLTSSATEAFSISQSASRPRRPEFSVFCIEGHVAAPAPHSTTAYQMDDDFPASLSSDCKQAATPDLAAGHLGAHTLTPPWQPMGLSRSNMSMQQGQIGQTSSSHRHAVPKHTSESFAPAQKRIAAANYPASEALPTPPATPQQRSKASSPRMSIALQPPNTAVTRRRGEGGPKSNHDSKLQTAIEPPHWSTNCTVLKADSSTDKGNVVSPTCMVGLPFGGMVEMMLPLPGGEIKDVE